MSYPTLIFGSNFAQRKFELEAKNIFDDNFISESVYVKPEGFIEQIEEICKQANLTYVLYKETIYQTEFKTQFGEIIIENKELKNVTGRYEHIVSNLEQAIQLIKD